MLKKTITIVIPAYNEEQNIRTCLEAIAHQTVSPDHVIVVDNNSTDATAGIAKSYAWVTVLHERKQGIVFARNTGFMAVKTDIIARIDADTRLKPGWVHNVMQFYEKHDDIAITGRSYVYNVYWPKLLGRAQHVIAYGVNRIIFHNSILWGSNMALPTKMWRDVRYKTHIHNNIHEDLDLAVHLIQAGYETRYRKNMLVGVRLRRVHTHRKQLWKNLMMWPRTFRFHGYKLWPIAFIGSVILYSIVLPATGIEKIAMKFGSQQRLKRRKLLH